MGKRAAVPLFSLPPELGGVNLVFFETRWREEEHTNQSCEFLWLRRGRAVLETPDGRHPAVADDFLLIPRNTPHRDLFETATPYEVLHVNFGWLPWEEELFRRLTPEAVRRLSSEARREIAYLLDRLYAAVARGRPLAKSLAAALFHAALLRLLDAVDGAAETAEPEPYGHRRDQWLVEEAKHHIAEHFHRRLTAADVAAALGVSEFHLARRFAAAAGESLHDHLLAHRFARAEALLLEGRLTVAQIAHQTGFANGGYFAKAFKKRYGLTPKAFLAARPPRRF